MLPALKSDMDTLISQSKDSVTAVKEEYETSVKDKLNSLTENLNRADDSVAGLMSELDNSVKKYFRYYRHGFLRPDPGRRDAEQFRSALKRSLR